MHLTRIPSLAAWLLVCIPFWINAQTTKISGKVTDAQGEVLSGANVFIVDSYDGATSDADGKFSFSTTETGDRKIKITYLGYDDFEQAVTLNGTPVEVAASLKEGFTETNTVVISAGGFGASDKNKAVILNPLDIVTTAGALGDVYGALQFLPGTQRVGEEAGLFVRGGDASETATIIDGMIVQQPFFSTVPDVASRARFSPFLFKGTFFSTGGYSARYGQAMSSALILGTTDLADTSAGGLNLTMVGGGGFYTKKWPKSSLSLQGGYSDVTAFFLLNPQVQKYEIAPRAGESSLIYRYKTSPSGIFKFYATYNTQFFVLSNRVSGYSEFYDLRTHLRAGNLYANASYRESLGEKWLVEASASFSDDRNKINLMGYDASPGYGYLLDLNTSSVQNRTQGKLTFSRTLGKQNTLWFGGEAHDIRNNSEFELKRFGIGGEQNISDIYSAGYAEGEVYFSPKLAGRVGARAEYSTFLQDWNVSPRASLALKLGKYGSTSVAYGQFYQTPYGGYLRSNDLQTAFLSSDFTYERADHYLANYQYIRDKRTLRVEAYYKNYASLLRQVNPTFIGTDTLVRFNNSGFGYAQGVDLFWRDQESIKNGDYWLSYSFLDTKRLFRDYPIETTPTFAAAHTFSAVYKQWIGKIRSQVGASYAFATGRPYFNPDPDVAFLSERTTNYHTLNMNWSYITTIQNNFTVIFFSFSNVLGRNNVFGYRYTQDGLTGEPVFPTSRRSIFLGAFIAFR